MSPFDFRIQHHVFFRKLYLIDLLRQIFVQIPSGHRFIRTDRKDHIRCFDALPFHTFPGQEYPAVISVRIIEEDIVLLFENRIQVNRFCPGNRSGPGLLCSEINGFFLRVLRPSAENVSGFLRRFRCIQRFAVLDFLGVQNSSIAVMELIGSDGRILLRSLSGNDVDREGLRTELRTFRLRTAGNDRYVPAVGLMQHPEGLSVKLCIQRKCHGNLLSVRRLDLFSVTIRETDVHADRIRNHRVLRCSLLRCISGHAVGHSGYRHLRSLREHAFRNRCADSHTIRSRTAEMLRRHLFFLRGLIRFLLIGLRFIGFSLVGFFFIRFHFIRCRFIGGRILLLRLGSRDALLFRRRCFLVSGFPGRLLNLIRNVRLRRLLPGRSFHHLLRLLLCLGICLRTLRKCRKLAECVQHQDHRCQQQYRNPPHNRRTTSFLRSVSLTPHTLPPSFLPSNSSVDSR